MSQAAARFKSANIQTAVEALSSSPAVSCPQAQYGEDAFRQQPQPARQSGPSQGGDPNAVPLGQRIDANAIPLGKRADPTPPAAPLDPIPEIEWWDRPLLIKRESEGVASHSYGEEDAETLANLNLTAITLYVQHPVQIEPPAEEAPPEAMPLMLTKKVRLSCYQA